jgi:hypothetical protein
MCEAVNVALVCLLLDIGKKGAIWQVIGVLLSTGGMLRRCVECVKTVEFGLDFASGCNGKANLFKMCTMRSMICVSGWRVPKGASGEGSVGSIAGPILAASSFSSNLTSTSAKTDFREQP